MEKVALLAAMGGALAVIVVSIRLCLLIVRAQSAVDHLGQLLEEEARPTVRAWRDAARGVQTAAGKLGRGLDSLASTLGRVDRITERLEPDVLALRAMEPAAAKVVSWLSGLRKGLAGVAGQQGAAKGAGGGVETEVG